LFLVPKQMPPKGWEMEALGESLDSPSTCDTAFPQYVCIQYLFNTPEVKLQTYYGMVFVRLSVRLSVSHIMFAQYFDQFMRDSHGTW